MRIATWNVERVKPRGWKIAPAQRDRMRHVDADIWILTETHLEHGPGAEYQSVHTPSVPERRPVDERWVGIWSRYRIEALSEPAPKGRGTIAADVTTPRGSVIVHGCVIPYANEPILDCGSPAKMWQAHAEMVERLDRDLEAIRRHRAGVPIVLAGDFNQDRDGSGWYGTHEVRARLGEVLERHELDCVTSVDVAAAGMLEERHLVDHICLSSELADGCEVVCWETTNANGVRMSDHPTVAVDVWT